MSISGNTRVTLTLGFVAAAVVALVGTGWRAGTEAAAIRAEITELRRDIRAAAGASWTISDMERWSYLLERANIERTLAVPSVRGVKAERGQ